MTLPPRRLEPADALPLQQLFAAQSDAYLAHFHPFAFTVEAITDVIEKAEQDRIWAIESDGELAGLFMLRGFDAGFQRPAFGVFVAEAYAGRGLAKRALAYSVDWCRDHEVERLMLKVHPDNHRARAAYLAFGFSSIGFCDRTGHEMFELITYPS